MSDTNKNTAKSRTKNTAASIGKKIAMKLVPPLVFIVIFCVICFGIYKILLQNEKFASLMVSVEYAIDVIVNGVEEEEDTLTRAQPTTNSIVLPYGISSTAAFEVTLDDGTLLPDPDEAVDDTLTVAPEETDDEPTSGAEVGHSMYVVFNGIANRETGYFYAPDGTLTLTAKATGESVGMKSFKIALWEKLVGETAYVADTTIYFYTNDETNTYTITGLDPNTAYRMNFSYDAYGYYIYGVMQVDGVSFVAPPVAEEATLAEDEAA